MSMQPIPSWALETDGRFQLSQMTLLEQFLSPLNSESALALDDALIQPANTHELVLRGYKIGEIFALGYPTIRLVSRTPTLCSAPVSTAYMTPSGLQGVWFCTGSIITN